jgi:methylenetetrahydrofolate reductase (NADPH)
MRSLQEQLTQTNDFLYGIELVSSRGILDDVKAAKTREMANALKNCNQTFWVSITDNAGGNPQLAPVSLGRPLLYSGKEVIIHLSCKDFNRNGLESEAWHLASEGFHNILALSGDAPIFGHHGNAKGVFDIDSVALLSLLKEMNEGMEYKTFPTSKKVHKLSKTQFFSGCAFTNFKLHENEVMPQYLKLEKKIECGADFVIIQIGYDTRKMHEMLAYMDQKQLSTPMIGNVYLLNCGVAKVFYNKKIPGVVVPESLFKITESLRSSPDKGKSFFLELAAKQSAIYRGLGFRGSYFGGVHSYGDLQKIYRIEKSFSADDWKIFAKEINYNRPGEFYLYEKDHETSLCIPGQLEPSYVASLKKRSGGSLTYKFSHAMHKLMFTPDSMIAKLGSRMVKRSKDSRQGPKLMRMAEHASKVVLFGCKDCGDCSLPDIAYLCPESQCAKNQRNGPCGGTRDGICEVHDFECIWARAYDRLKPSGKELDLLGHAPVIQDQGLRGTSSWANTWLGCDHHGKKELIQIQPKPSKKASTTDVVEITLKESNPERKTNNNVSTL